MKKSYRADQIGSMVRPHQLLEARDNLTSGRDPREDLRELEDEVILDLLAMQREVGLEIFGDGEMRRDAWQANFSQAVEGFEKDYPVIERTRADGSVARLVMHSKAVASKVQAVGRIAEVDAKFLKQHAPGPFKITMPSPSYVARASWRKGTTDRAYSSQAELQADVAVIVRDEMKALVADGTSYIQLDEGFTDYVREGWIVQKKAEGFDPDELIRRDIAADNSCYEAVCSKEVTVAMHLCRGSRTSAANPSASYEWLAEHIFDALHVDRFLLEYDSEGERGFAPLRFLPKGKVAVLGFVSSKNPLLETEDHLMRRIDEASKHTSIDQLALSPSAASRAPPIRTART
jgi:5-methyltetrahydropteroyltriglutamate--homocysteine methyltransferase